MRCFPGLRERAGSAHTSGPAFLNIVFQVVSGIVESAAQGGIARGSDEREECAERKAQEGAATDSCAVGEDISEFHGAAGREVLAGFEKNSEDEHR